MSIIFSGLHYDFCTGNDPLIPKLQEKRSPIVNPWLSKAKSDVASSQSTYRGSNNFNRFTLAFGRLFSKTPKTIDYLNVDNYNPYAYSLVQRIGLFFTGQKFKEQDRVTKVLNHVGKLMSSLKVDLTEFKSNSIVNTEMRNVLSKKFTDRNIFLGDIINQSLLMIYCYGLVRYFVRKIMTTSHQSMGSVKLRNVSTEPSRLNVGIESEIGGHKIKNILTHTTPILDIRPLVGIRADVFDKGFTDNVIIDLNVTIEPYITGDSKQTYIVNRDFGLQGAIGTPINVYSRKYTKYSPKTFNQKLLLIVLTKYHKYLTTNDYLISNIIFNLIKDELTALDVTNLEAVNVYIAGNIQINPSIVSANTFIPFSLTHFMSNKDINVSEEDFVNSLLLYSYQEPYIRTCTDEVTRFYMRYQLTELYKLDDENLSNISQIFVQGHKNQQMFLCGLFMNLYLQEFKPTLPIPYDMVAIDKIQPVKDSFEYVYIEGFNWDEFISIMYLPSPMFNPDEFHGTFSTLDIKVLPILFHLLDVRAVHEEILVPNDDVISKNKKLKGMDFHKNLTPEQVEEQVQEHERQFGPIPNGNSIQVITDDKVETIQLAPGESLIDVAEREFKEKMSRLGNKPKKTKEVEEKKNLPSQAKATMNKKSTITDEQGERIMGRTKKKFFDRRVKKDARSESFKLLSVLNPSLVNPVAKSTLKLDKITKEENERRAKDNDDKVIKFIKEGKFTDKMKELINNKDIKDSKKESLFKKMVLNELKRLSKKPLVQEEPKGKVDDVKLGVPNINTGKVDDTTTTVEEKAEGRIMLTREEAIAFAENFETQPDSRNEIEYYISANMKSEWKGNVLPKDDFEGLLIGVDKLQGPLSKLEAITSSDEIKDVVMYSFKNIIPTTFGNDVKLEKEELVRNKEQVRMGVTVYINIAFMKTLELLELDQVTINSESFGDNKHISNVVIDINDMFVLNWKEYEENKSIDSKSKESNDEPNLEDKKDSDEDDVDNNGNIGMYSAEMDYQAKVYKTISKNVGHKKLNTLKTLATKIDKEELKKWVQKCIETFTNDPIKATNEYSKALRLYSMKKDKVIRMLINYINKIDKNSGAAKSIFDMINDDTIKAVGTKYDIDEPLEIGSCNKACAKYYMFYDKVANILRFRFNEIDNQSDPVHVIMIDDKYPVSWYSYRQYLAMRQMDVMSLRKDVYNIYISQLFKYRLTGEEKGYLDDIKRISGVGTMDKYDEGVISGTNVKDIGINNPYTVGFIPYVIMSGNIINLNNRVALVPLLDTAHGEQSIGQEMNYLTTMDNKRLITITHGCGHTSELALEKITPNTMNFIIGFNIHIGIKHEIIHKLLFNIFGHLMLKKREHTYKKNTPFYSNLGRTTVSYFDYTIYTVVDKATRRRMGEYEDQENKIYDLTRYEGRRGESTSSKEIIEYTHRTDEHYNLDIGYAQEYWDECIVNDIVLDYESINQGTLDKIESQGLMMKAVVRTDIVVNVIIGISSEDYYNQGKMENILMSFTFITNNQRAKDEMLSYVYDYAHATELMYNDRKDVVKQHVMVNYFNLNSRDDGGVFSSGVRNESLPNYELPTENRVHIFSRTKEKTNIYSMTPYLDSGEKAKIYHGLPIKAHLESFKDYMDTGHRLEYYNQDPDGPVKKRIWDVLFKSDTTGYRDMMDNYKDRIDHSNANTSQRSMMVEEVGRTLGFLHNCVEGKQRLENQIMGMKEAPIAKLAVEMNDEHKYIQTPYVSGEEALLARAIMNMPLNTSSGHKGRTSAQWIMDMNPDTLRKSLHTVDRAYRTKIRLDPGAKERFAYSRAIEVRLIDYMHNYHLYEWMKQQTGCSMNYDTYELSQKYNEGHRKGYKMYSLDFKQFDAHHSYIDVFHIKTQCGIKTSMYEQHIKYESYTYPLILASSGKVVLDRADRLMSGDYLTSFYGTYGQRSGIKTLGSKYDIQDHMSIGDDIVIAVRPDSKVNMETGVKEADAVSSPISIEKCYEGVHFNRRVGSLDHYPYNNPMTLINGIYRKEEQGIEITINSMNSRSYDIYTSFICFSVRMLGQEEGHKCIDVLVSDLKNRVDINIEQLNIKNIKSEFDVIAYREYPMINALKRFMTKDVYGSTMYNLFQIDPKMVLSRYTTNPYVDKIDIKATGRTGDTRYRIDTQKISELQLSRIENVPYGLQQKVNEKLSEQISETSALFVDCVAKLNLRTHGTGTYYVRNSYDLVRALAEHIERLYPNTKIHASNHKGLNERSKNIF